MGTRGRALSDWEILGLRAGHEYGSLNGTVGGSQTFTASYIQTGKRATAGRLRGRDIARFMMMAGGACHLPKCRTRTERASRDKEQTLDMGVAPSRKGEREGYR